MVLDYLQRLEHHQASGQAPEPPPQPPLPLNILAQRNPRQHGWCLNGRMRGTAKMKE